MFGDHCFYASFCRVQVCERELLCRSLVLCCCCVSSLVSDPLSVAWSTQLFLPCSNTPNTAYAGYVLTCYKCVLPWHLCRQDRIWSHHSHPLSFFPFIGNPRKRKKRRPTKNKQKTYQLTFLFLSIPVSYFFFLNSNRTYTSTALEKVSQTRSRTTRKSSGNACLCAATVSGESLSTNKNQNSGYSGKQ